MDIAAALRAVRALWWVVALCAGLGAAAAGAVNSVTVPRYTTDMQFFVSTPDPVSTSDAFTGSQFARDRVVSYARLLAGEQLAGRVVDRLDLSMSARELQGAIEAAPVSETVLIDVFVSDTDPERAQEIASTLADEFMTLVAELESTAGGANSAVRVTMTGDPRVPSEPSEPMVVRNYAVGIALGLLLGVGIAIGRDLFDRSVKTSDQVAAFAGAPVIGSVWRARGFGRRHLADWQAPGDPVSEAFRRVRNNLQYLAVDQPPRVIMISSAVAAEGKTTTVINLGVALAEAGQRVAIVEADLRDPKVARYLGLIGEAGLTNVLAGTAALEEVLQPYGTGVVEVLAAGPLPPNPGELLASESMRGVLDKLRGAVDYVLVDAPPLLPVADASGLAVMMDGVLLSVRHGSTTHDQLRQAALTLDRVGAKVLGVVLNFVPQKTDVDAAYGYGYGGDGARHS